MSTKTTLGTIACEKVVFEASVTKNNGTEVAVAGKGEGITTNCKVNGTIGVTITDFTVTTILIPIPPFVVVFIHFQVHFPGGIKCSYSASD